MGVDGQESHGKGGQRSMGRNKIQPRGADGDLISRPRSSLFGQIGELCLREWVSFDHRCVA